MSLFGLAALLPVLTFSGAALTFLNTVEVSFGSAATLSDLVAAFLSAAGTFSITRRRFFLFQTLLSLHYVAITLQKTR